MMRFPCCSERERAARRAQGVGLLTGVSQGCIRREGTQRRPRRRLDRRLEEVAEAIGGGCCRLQLPWKPALGVTGTVAGHMLGALEGGVAYHLPMHPWFSAQERRASSVLFVSVQADSPSPNPNPLC